MARMICSRNAAHRNAARARLGRRAAAICLCLMLGGCGASGSIVKQSQTEKKLVVTIHKSSDAADTQKNVFTLHACLVSGRFESDQSPRQPKREMNERHGREVLTAPLMKGEVGEQMGVRVGSLKGPSVCVQTPANEIVCGVPFEGLDVKAKINSFDPAAGTGTFAMEFLRSAAGVWQGRSEDIAFRLDEPAVVGSVSTTTETTSDSTSQ